MILMRMSNFVNGYPIFTRTSRDLIMRSTIILLDHQLVLCQCRKRQLQIYCIYWYSNYWRKAPDRYYLLSEIMDLQLCTRRDALSQLLWVSCLFFMRLMTTGKTPWLPSTASKNAASDERTWILRVVGNCDHSLLYGDVLLQQWRITGRTWRNILIRSLISTLSSYVAELTS